MNSFDLNGFNDNNNDCNRSDRRMDSMDSTETTNRLNGIHSKHVLSDEDFNIPEKLFVNDLEALERKTLSADLNHSSTRLSLLRKFDPLVDTKDMKNELLQRTNNLSLNESNNRFENNEINEINENLNRSSGRERQTTQDLKDMTDLRDMNDMTHNESTTLMNFNSPLIVPNLNSKPDWFTQNSDQNNSIQENNDKNYEQLLNEFRTKELVFHEKLIEKDRHIHSLEENLNVVSNNCEKYQILLNLIHNFNEEVVQMASEVIDSLIADKNQLIDRCEEMTAQRSQALEEVNNVEKNFYEVHNRYDRVRTALEDSKLREQAFNEQYLELIDKLKEKDQMFELLKTRAEAKIEDANNYIESARRECESELIAVKAQLKRADMKMNGLQAQLDQKSKENDELTKMVDELIANVEK